MRFIVRELPYEQLIATGQFRYERDGRPTGALESWRLTMGAPGFEVLRVDLDARAAPSGRSTLFHLIRQENGRAERLNFRFWERFTITGNVLLAETAVNSVRIIDERQRCEDDLRPEPGYAFWFPSCVGLGLLASAADGATAVTLNNAMDDPAQAFALQQVTVRLAWSQWESIVIRGQEMAVRPLTVAWSDQQRTLWLDEYNWPVKMARQDGLTAVETRLIRYRH